MNHPTLSKTNTLLAISALGIIFGDIGTSPLYAFRECFRGTHGLPVSYENIVGILSMILWSLIIVVSIKYVALLLNISVKGEGGLLALLSIVSKKTSEGAKGRSIFIVVGMLGATFFYADSMITPAISVLSAVEGINTVTHMFEPFIIVIALAILITLFAFQYRGTEKISKLFGPIMLIWFTTLGVLGAVWIVKNPVVLKAVSPHYAIMLFQHHQWAALIILGVVFLAITGAEALYYDLGHFGKRPVRLAWFFIVLPGLVLNYFGQGAYLLTTNNNQGNFFFQLAPQWALIPLVILATCATVIASQAVITGLYSVTSQAVKFGFWPRLKIIHTSSKRIGQIYIPSITLIFLVGIILLILIFRDSGQLVFAYGLAVASEMLLTTLLMYKAMHMTWKWNPHFSNAVITLFLLVDLTFLFTNVLKIPSGGWFPIVIASFLFIAMRTWYIGFRYIEKLQKEETLPIEAFMPGITDDKPLRVPGIAIYLTRQKEGIPRTLLHNLKHNKVLHEATILLSIVTERTPEVPEENRFTIIDYTKGLYRLIIHYGYREDPDIEETLKQATSPYFEFNPQAVTYFIGRETLIPSKLRKLRLSLWRRKLFTFMHQNGADAAEYFRIPPNQVVELGAQVEI